jgi:hypothetical protein
MSPISKFPKTGCSSCEAARLKKEAAQKVRKVPTRKKPPTKKAVPRPARNAHLMKKAKDKKKRKREK